jgi:hypothetical protein
MKTVEFKFDIDQKVRVEKLGIDGFVTVCAIDDCGNCYFVKTTNGGDWYYERHLTGTEGE